ncbi:hypothetical protein KC345_g1252 [Hortaea werneckii]|nr:hypothetical protein KC345_g1252 [Hortaea werneckii]
MAIRVYCGASSKKRALHKHHYSIATTTTAAATTAAAIATATTTTPPPPPPPPVVEVPAIQKMAYRHDYPTLVAAKRRPAGRGPGTPPPRWILAAPPQDTPSGLQLWNVFVKRALRWLAKRCPTRSGREGSGEGCGGFCFWSRDGDEDGFEEWWGAEASVKQWKQDIHALTHAKVKARLSRVDSVKGSNKKVIKIREAADDMSSRDAQGDDNVKVTVPDELKINKLVAQVKKFVKGTVFARDGYYELLRAIINPLRILTKQCTTSDQGCTF